MRHSIVSSLAALALALPSVAAAAPPAVAVYPGAELMEESDRCCAFRARQPFAAIVAYYQKALGVQPLDLEAASKRFPELRDAADQSAELEQQLGTKLQYRIFVLGDRPAPGAEPPAVSVVGIGPTTVIRIPVELVDARQPRVAAWREERRAREAEARATERDRRPGAAEGAAQMNRTAELRAGVERALESHGVKLPEGTRFLMITAFPASNDGKGMVTVGYAVPMKLDAACARFVPGGAGPHGQPAEDRDTTRTGYMVGKTCEPGSPDWWRPFVEEALLPVGDSGTTTRSETHLTFELPGGTKDYMELKRIFGEDDLEERRGEGE